MKKNLKDRVATVILAQNQNYNTCTYIFTAGSFTHFTVRPFVVGCITIDGTVQQGAYHQSQA